MPFDHVKSFRPGQSLLCLVEAQEVGGYLVKLSGDLRGFLPSQEPLKIGSEVPATFVCMNGDRALLTFAYMIGATERVQLSTENDSINAFAVWADSYPSSKKSRRAVDIIMPPLSGFGTGMAGARHDLREIVAHIEKTKMTGCLKAQSEEQLSRSAALLYEGRVVGSIYTTKKSKIAPSTTETSLNLMVADLKDAATEIQLYTLPEEIVLSMSALFFGLSAQELLKGGTRTDALALLKTFEASQKTACITISSHELATIALSFVHQGEYLGSFLVEKQKFIPSLELPLDLPDRYDDAVLDASFLPNEMTSESIQFGYVLHEMVERAPRLEA